MLNWILAVLLGIAATTSGAAGRAKEPVKPKLYSLPVKLKDDVVRAVMLDNLSLEEPRIYLGYSGEPLDDSTLKRHQPNKTILAFWDVKGSKDEAAQVFTIDGPANMRIEPHGKVSAIWLDGKPVRLLRSNQEWRLVSDREKKYAWTHMKNLRTIPAGKILLDPSSALAKGMPASLTRYLETNLDLKITELRKITDSKNKEELKGARARLCPNDFTEAEKDGLIPSEIIGGIETNGRRETLARLCGELSSTPNQPLKKVTLKVDKCHCYHAQMGDIDPIVIASKSEFPSKSPEGKMECEKARFHVFCSVMQVCGEGCDPGVVACPMKCLDFE